MTSTHTDGLRDAAEIASNITANSSIQSLEAYRVAYAISQAILARAEQVEKDQRKSAGQEAAGYAGTTECSVQSDFHPSPEAALADTEIEQAAREYFCKDLDWSKKENLGASAVQRAAFRAGAKYAIRQQAKEWK